MTSRNWQNLSNYESGQTAKNQEAIATILPSFLFPSFPGIGKIAKRCLNGSTLIL